MLAWNKSFEMGNQSRVMFFHENVHFNIQYLEQRSLGMLSTLVLPVLLSHQYYNTWNVIGSSIGNKQKWLSCTEASRFHIFIPTQITSLQILWLHLSELCTDASKKFLMSSIVKLPASLTRSHASKLRHAKPIEPLWSVLPIALSDRHYL